MKNYITVILISLLSVSAFADTADPSSHTSWQITPQNYQYSMTVTAALVFGNTESRDVTDSIAAFVGTDCRGVAGPVTYVPETDRYLVHLIIYSNSPSGESIKLYMYDNSEDEIIEVAQELDFAANASYGNPQDPYMVLTTFDVTLLIKAGNYSIVGAEVMLNDYDTQISNSTGTVIFNDVEPAENMEYTVTTDNYDILEGTLTVTDAELSDTAYLTVTNTFNITDGISPLEDAIVTLDGYGSKTTAGTGTVSFTGITPADSISFSVECDRYDYYTDSITAIVTGGSEMVALTLTTYNVSFTITDSGVPVEDATVTLNGYGSLTTGSNGKLTFEEIIPAEGIEYLVEAENFDPKEGRITVSDSDVLNEIDLTLTAFDVLFNVIDGDLPVENATVNLDGYGTQITNSYGEVIFEQVPLNDSISYTITHEKYNDFTDSVAVVNGIVTEKSILTLSLYNITFNITFDGLPLKDATVAITSNNADRVEDFTTTELPDEFTTESNALWYIDTTETMMGIYTAKSGLIYDNQSSELSLQTSTLNGTMSFFIKVSSEEDNDILKFFIDGQIAGSWSGNIPWQRVYFDIIPGNHTFKWVYEKDGSKSEGSDCAWIDYLVLPAATAQTKTATTDNEGIARFYNVRPSDSIFYQVTASDYLTATGDVTLGQANLSEDVEMIHLYDITFEVKSNTAWGVNPLHGVVIQLEGYNQQVTDNSGQTIFEGIVPENLIPYYVYFDNKKVTEGTISIVASDETVSVTLAPEEKLVVTNFVSPNGDGHNDYWEIENAERYASFKIIIYNSAGELIFETTNYHANKWDGTYKGAGLPDGVYYYMLKNGNGEIKFKGLINLIK